MPDEDQGLLGEADDKGEGEGEPEEKGEQPDEKETPETEEKETPEATEEEKALDGFESVADLRKAHDDTLAGIKAPDKYEIPKDVKDDLDTKSPELKEFTEFAKKAGIGQKHFDALLKWRVEQTKAVVAAQEKAKDASLKALGPNYGQRLNSVAAFLKGNLTGPEFKETAKAIGYSHHTVIAMEKLIKLTRGTEVKTPTGKVSKGGLQTLKDQLNTAIAERRGKQGGYDPALDDTIRELGAKIAKAEAK